MLIAVDARALRRPMAGIGRYQFLLGQALAEVLPEARFVVVGCRPLDIEIPGPAGRWTAAWDPAPGWGALPRLVWLRHRAGTFARSLGAEVFWGGSLQIPRPTPGLTTLLTVYDLVHREAPETLGWKGRIALSLFLRGDLRRADAVVAISQGTADRVEAWTGRRPDGLARPAVDASFAPPTADDLAAWRSQRKLPGRYLLALGTHEPRKNLALLATAWGKARNAGRLGDLRLVLAGRPGWRHAAVDRALAALGPDLMDLGYLPGSELPLALAGAEALAFPSRYEGFGMPVAEALAVGTPVLAADLPEIAEASQGRHRLIDLTVPALAEALAEVAAGTLPRPAAAVLPWTWTSEARTMARVIRSLVPGHV